MEVSEWFIYSYILCIVFCSFFKWFVVFVSTIILLFVCLFVFFSNEQLKLLQCGWKLLLVFHMKSPYLGEEEDNFLQKKKCWIIYCIACIVHVSHLKHKV